MTDQHPWLDELVRHIGEREVKGPKHNPLILEWGRAAGISWWNNDEDAWCAVAVNGVLAKTGFAGTRSALARSFVTWGIELKTPVPGAIVVFPRGPNPIYGHVGIVERMRGRTGITTVNGNVADMVIRSERKVSEILPGGIRWPADAELPAGADAAGLPPPRLGARILRYGVAGPDVKEWQERLTQMGYGQFEGTGWFGPKTRDETKRLQDVRQLRVDGEVGPATLAESLVVLQEIAGGAAPTSDAPGGRDHGRPVQPVPSPGPVQSPSPPETEHSRVPSTGRIAGGIVAAAVLAGIAGMLLNGDER